MGRSFKLKFQSNNKYKKDKEIKEIKEIKYNHIYKINTNPSIIKEFKKNMDEPSNLWGEDIDIIYKYNQKIFKDKGLCCEGEEDCICDSY